jgi:hypothetical protein
MANNGKWLEKKVQEALKEFQTTRKSFFHRFPDSTSARGKLTAQPGDYLWLLPDVPAILLEVKSTEKSASLRSLLDEGQCGKHRLWLRAGHITAFVYGDEAKNQLSWHQGQEVVNRAKGTTPIWKGSLEEVKDMLDAVSTLLTVPEEVR